MQVEEQYRVEGQEVLWYVVSDCARLRGKAAELYGAKVMLPQGETPVEHLGHSSGNATRDILAFRVAFAEQWLLGMTDFQVCAALGGVRVTVWHSKAITAGAPGATWVWHLWTMSGVVSLHASSMENQQAGPACLRR